MTTKTDPTLTENTDYLTSSSSSTTTPVALTAPVLTLDQADTDYAPGETVGITASNVAVGGSVQFSVAHVTGGVDGIVGTADDVLTHDLSGTVAPWTVTDGGAGDLDGAANGAIQTSWYVNQDAAYQAFVLSATDEATGATAQTAFTDAPGSTNKVYQHWADAGGPEWNNNILNDNKSNYFEGEVVPHVALLLGLEGPCRRRSTSVEAAQLRSSLRLQPSFMVRSVASSSTTSMAIQSKVPMNQAFPAGRFSSTQTTMAVSIRERHPRSPGPGALTASRLRLMPTRPTPTTIPILSARSSSRPGPRRPRIPRRS